MATKCSLLIRNQHNSPAQLTRNGVGSTRCQTSMDWHGQPAPLNFSRTHVPPIAQKHSYGAELQMRYAFHLREPLSLSSQNSLLRWDAYPYKCGIMHPTPPEGCWKNNCNERAQMEGWAGALRKNKCGWKAEQLDPKKYTVILFSTGTVCLSTWQTGVV